MDHPRENFQLCILIPCYNNLQGLKKSLGSIKYEKGKYFIVIVDDGSQNAFTKHELGYGQDGAVPLHIIRLPSNVGITTALNTGLQWISQNIICVYVARLDCGDICDPRRFYMQMDYLRVNTHVALLGSWCLFQSPTQDLSFRYKAPTQHNKIKREMYFRNAFIHPTVIFRIDMAENLGFYPQGYPYAEDYAFFWKIVNQAETAILPAYLVVCELNTKGISSQNRIKQLSSRQVIVQDFGHTFALRVLGMLKIKILMKIPYSFVLSVKKLM